MVDIKKLSPAAQELVRLCPPDGRGHAPDVQVVLRERPELLAGLNEYIEYCVETGELIAESKVPPKAGHAMATAAKKLSGKKPPKKG